MMATHQELITEMPSLERMSIQERLKHARKRRTQQLKRYNQYERDLQKKTKRINTQTSEDIERTHHRNVSFAENIQLLEAAARGDCDEVLELLKSGVDPNTGNEDGLTALHQSCIDNNEAMMKILLENGAEVNITDRELWTPLHAASTCGHMKLAQALIACGADLLAINSDGNMPYDICEDEETLDYIESQMAAQDITQDHIDDLREVAPNQMLEEMKKIHEEGGSLDYRNSLMATPLHVAVAQGFEKVVLYLLDNGVNVHAEDKDGWQPIHAAACWAQAEIIQILVENGADLDARTQNNETPLSLCEEDDIKSLIHQLKTETANRTRQNNQLIRRSSSRKNRGSSVRRSSKREKGEMRKMDAKGEAAFIQSRSEVPATNIDDIVAEGAEPISTLSESNSTDDAMEKNDDAVEKNENGVSNPDVILTDEELPKSELSINEGENKEKETTVEPPDQKTDFSASEDFSINDDDPRSGTEPRRLKSILKKTALVEPEEPKKREEKSKEEKQKEKEKEKQRIKEEKEREKQRAREKSKVKEKKKDKILLKEKRPQSAGIVVEETVQIEEGGNDNPAVDIETTEVAINGAAETLPELKRQRQQTNSPLHKKSDSPNPSIASSDNNGESVRRREMHNGPSGKNHRTRSPGFGTRLRLSLPFVGSYTVHDPSDKYDEKKRNLMAMNGQENVVISSIGDSNSHDDNSDSTEKDSMKRFTGTPEEGLPDDEATETCCKLM